MEPKHSLKADLKLLEHVKSIESNGITVSDSVLLPEE